MVEKKFSDLPALPEGSVLPADFLAIINGGVTKHLTIASLLRTLPVGAVTAPSLKFGTGQESGFYYDATQNEIHVVINGASVGSFDATGISLSDFTNAGHTHADTANGGQIAHTALTAIGSNSHAQIDTAITDSVNHIADATKHFLLLDQDDMGDDDATKAPSQQSTKKYVDDLIAPSTSHIADATKHFLLLDQDDMGDDDATKAPSQQSTKAHVATAKSEAISASNSYADAHGLVQQVNVQDGEVDTGSTIIPYNDDIPQNTDGDEYLTLAITPTNAANVLYIEVEMQLASSIAASHTMVVALFKDSGVNSIGSSHKSASSGHVISMSLKHRIVAGSTSEQTFKVRAGAHAAGTTTFNGITSARRLGGVLISSITIKEMKA